MPYQLYHGLYISFHAMSAGVYIPGYYKGIYNNMYVQDITWK